MWFNEPVCDAQKVNTRQIVVLQITFLSKKLIAHAKYKTAVVERIDLCVQTKPDDCLSLCVFC